MRRFLMPGTDLWAAPICLGTAHLTVDDEKAAFDQLDRFAALGGNLIDTANAYGRRLSDDDNRSERVIGRWLERGSQADEMLISTKGGFPNLEDRMQSRLDPVNLEADLESSRQALGRDRLDLYFLHRDDPNEPVEKLLSLLEDFRRQGKIRWYGLSNWQADRLQAALDWCAQLTDCGLAAVQNHWSLAQYNQDGSSDLSMAAADEPTVTIIRKHNTSLMAYAAMAKGFFAKLTPGGDVTALPDKLRRYYLNELNLKRAEAVWRIAGQRGITPAEVALAWLLHQQFPVFPIVSFSSLRQLEEAMRAPSVRLDKAEMAELSAGSVV
jgi:aryl-alcohol dehydrogenase-like predicted oxidoreductase